MTTSRETEDLDFPQLRALVDAANALPLADRMTLLKALVPGVTADLSHVEFAAFVDELLLKGQRWYEAEASPGLGRAWRVVPGERTLEGR